MLVQHKGAAGEERLRRQRFIIPTGCCSPGRSACCQLRNAWHGACKITKSFRFLVISTKIRADPPTTKVRRAEDVPALGAATQHPALSPAPLHQGLTRCQNSRRAQSSQRMEAGRAPRLSRLPVGSTQGREEPARWGSEVSQQKRNKPGSFTNFWGESRNGTLAPHS